MLQVRIKSQTIGHFLIYQTSSFFRLCTNVIRSLAPKCIPDFVAGTCISSDCVVEKGKVIVCSYLVINNLLWLKNRNKWTHMLNNEISEFHMKCVLFLGWKRLRTRIWQAPKVSNFEPRCILRRVISEVPLSGIHMFLDNFGAGDLCLLKGHLAYTISGLYCILFFRKYSLKF